MKQESNDRSAVRTRDVRRRADAAASLFDSADFVHEVTRSGLLTRLQPLLVEPARVLDLGSATGSAAAPLKKRFRGAHLISLDLSAGMLRRARRKQRWYSRPRASFVQAEASSLPFQSQSIDVVFSNLLLPFVGRPDAVFAEVARVLRTGGVFAFATLGPDTFEELRQAWRQVDSGPHVSLFPDMHDIGDALVRAGLRDPVLDVDRLTVEYAAPERLFRDLGSTAARNSLSQRSRSLLGRERFRRFAEALTGASADSAIRLDLELVYGHCWGGGPRVDPSHYAIDAATISRRRR